MISPRCSMKVHEGRAKEKGRRKGKGWKDKKTRKHWGWVNHLIQEN